MNKLKLLMSKPKIFIPAGILLTLILTSIAIVIVNKSGIKSPLPPSITEATSFNIYVPTKNSLGYTVDRDSATYSNGILVFNLTTPDGKTLTITEQAMPKDILNQLPKPTLAEDLPTGKLYMIDLVDRTTGSLFTRDGTWILTRSLTPIGSSNMKELFSSFKPIKK